MKNKKDISDKPFAFKKENYKIMLAGLLLIVLGFVIMSADQKTFGFGFLGLTLGPLILLIGFLVQFIAILYTPKKRDNK